MSTLQLVIGNKTFSDSSLRPWLLLKMIEVPFDEISIPLFQPDSAEKLGMVSPSLKVPVLIHKVEHDDIKSWDSLSICEYISESFLGGQGWPRDLKRKAAARSIVNECHADFSVLQKHWPMNCQITQPQLVNADIEKCIARLDSIMYCCRRKYGDGGEYLFGQFSIADCFLAPYCIALRNYYAELSFKSQQYIDTLLGNPWLQIWIEEANVEDHLENFKENKKQHAI